jgi:UDP-N-acetylmuramate--alanine ligase
VITNLEADHLDIYGTFEELESTFATFSSRISTDGHLLYCRDVPISSTITNRPATMSYGFSDDADWRIANYRGSDEGITFDLTAPDADAVTVSAKLRGRHNAQNATVAIAAAVLASVPIGDAVTAVAAFNGTRRRFETVYRDDRLWIVDDYAHHPTEIRATLSAAREAFSGQIWAVFQPHTTHRTRSLFQEFLTAFNDADRLILLPTYHPTGRELAEMDHDADDLARAMSHPCVELADSIDDAARTSLLSIPSNTLVLTMGAGDITTLGPILASAAHAS